MDFASSGLLLLPAFLIGAAFGIMIVLVLAGEAGVRSKRPLILSVAGSACGVLAFLLTQTWWPPIVGPFVLCPLLAVASALAALRR